MHIRRFFLITILSCTVLFFGTASVFAQGNLTINNADQLLQQVSDPQKTGLSQKNLSDSSGQLIKRVLGLVGLLFLGLTVYAGILWMSARGNDDQVNKARNTLFTALAGLAVILFAYAITSFLLTRLQPTIEGTASGNDLPGGQDGSRLGCCLDRVNAGWACRVTSMQDCQTQGTRCDVGDDFCDGTDYEFRVGLERVETCLAQCQQ